MKRIIFTILIALIFCLTSLSWAQLPKGKWWKLKEVAREVNLNEEQVQRIEKSFLKHKKKMIDLKATLEKEKLDLDAMFDADEFDEGAISTKIDLVEDARSKLHKTQLMFFVQIRKILSKEQYKKLREKKEEFKNMRRKMRNERRDQTMNEMQGKMKKRKDKMRGEPPCPDPPCMEGGFLND
jgi:Spy/CpxP family protein refolding chaperone